MSRAAGIKFSRDASDYIIEHLGSDRLVSRREIEKLIVYAGAKSEVSLEDAMAVIGDNGALSRLRKSSMPSAVETDRPWKPDCNERLLKVYHPSCWCALPNDIFNDCILLSLPAAKARPPHEAIKSLRPPVLFMFEERFQRQLTIWTETQLATALQLLTEAEGQCKSTGAPESGHWREGANAPGTSGTRPITNVLAVKCLRTQLYQLKQRWI